MESSFQVLNIAFYRFVRLRELPEWRVKFRGLCGELGLKGTVLLSEEGINAFLAGVPEKIEKFLEVLDSFPEFTRMTVKRSISNRVPFGRMRVKLKKEIISLGLPEIRPAEFTAPRVLPEQLKSWLDSGKEVILVDTRNDYETELGTFEGAVDLNLKRFRDFPQALAERKESFRDKTVVMFCTGGIRCEKATVVAVQQGFKDVYQLEGGILKYFEDCGDSYYRGACFVFDERIGLDGGLQPTG